MRIAQSCSSTVVSINTLPTEILQQIFNLVLSTQARVGKIADLTHTELRLPKYPDFLSHVCCRWRHAATCSHTLWRHIDLISRCHLSRKLVTRAIEYAARAGQSPLDIHVVEATPSSESYSTDIAQLDIVQFLDPVARRTGSLHVVTSSGATDFCYSVLQCCLPNCVPGKLIQLSIQHHAPDAGQFIETAENPQIPESLLLDMPQHFIEDLYLPITVLRVRGVCPRWESQAYHGLVELHLIQPIPSHRAGPPATITGAQIASILMSSLGLKIFRFNLKITDTLPNDTPILPLPLNALEVLDFPSIKYKQCETLLQWLAPSSNPLQLSFKLSHNTDWLTIPSAFEVESLFHRLNVTKVCLEGGTASLEHVRELLYLTPQLRVLALESFLGGGGYSEAFPPSQNDAQTTCSHLDHLYVSGCWVDDEGLQALQEMAEQHSVQKVTLWRCKYFSCADENSREEQSEHLINCVSSIFSDVKFLPWGDPNPIEDWGCSNYSSIPPS